uniref:Uncharacterized protein n=1 Tax=Anopheles atroparvus TaxID=41427 RepID=A0A182JB33_ANOAO
MIRSTVGSVVAQESSIEARVRLFVHNLQPASISAEVSSTQTNRILAAPLQSDSKMQLLKRKKTSPSFVISIESGVEEVKDVKVHEECDFLVDVLTGKRSVSPDFCCRMLYMILCTCFTSEASQQRRTRASLQQRPQTSYETI